MILHRRKFLIGAAAMLLAAPAIVRYESLMRVKPIGVDADGISGWIDEFRLVKEVESGTISFFYSSSSTWQYISRTVNFQSPLKPLNPLSPRNNPLHQFVS